MNQSFQQIDLIIYLTVCRRQPPVVYSFNLHEHFLILYNNSTTTMSALITKQNFPRCHCCKFSITLLKSTCSTVGLYCLFYGKIAKSVFSQVAPWSWNLGRPFSMPEKSWKIAKVWKVMDKSWKMMLTSWNFYYCTEKFRKSDTTSFIKSNYEP